MIKKSLIELIQHRLDPIDETGKFIYQVIEGYCNTIYPLFFEEAFRRKDTNIDLDHFTKRYDNVAILQDSESKRYYSTLPANIIHPKYGVRRITTAEGTSADFEPISEFDMMHMDNIDVGMISTTIYFSTKQDRVDYGYSMSASIAGEGVSMYLMVEFYEYDETDDVNVPDGRINEFITAVVNFANGTPAVDLINNNAQE